MNKMQKLSERFGFFLLLLLVFAVVSYLLMQQDQFAVFRDAVQRNVFWGAALYILLGVISIVFAPVTTIFLVPVAVEIFGPLATALMNILSWTIGSMIAFLLARNFGQPFLRKMKLFQKLKAYEKIISSSDEFWIIVFLRMVFPVDILSYALGFFSNISFKKYSLATLIGITPFSFLFSYLGQAFITRNFYLLFGILLFSVALFFLVWKIITGKFWKRKK